MKHNLEHYVSKFLGYVWLVALTIGSLALLGWIIKALLKVIGVM